MHAAQLWPGQASRFGRIMSTRPGARPGPDEITHAGGQQVWSKERKTPFEKVAVEAQALRRVTIPLAARLRHVLRGSGRLLPRGATREEVRHGDLDHGHLCRQR
jgi:hypothetical protein